MYSLGFGAHRNYGIISSHIQQPKLHLGLRGNTHGQLASVIHGIAAIVKKEKKNMSLRWNKIKCKKDETVTYLQLFLQHDIGKER